MIQRPANERLVILVGAHGFLGSAIRRKFVDTASIVEITSRSPFDTLSDQTIREASAVIWTASGVTPATAAEQPELTVAEVETYFEAVERIGKVAPETRILLASSGGTVYEESVRPPYAENAPTGSQIDYGRMKLEMEEITVRAGGTSMRLSNLYGKGQRARRGLGVIVHWMEALAAGRPLVVFGDGENARDYVEVSDAAEAFVTASLHPQQLPPALNVGSGTPITLNQLVNLLEEVVHPVTVRVDRTTDPRSFDRSVTWLDVSLIDKTLGWTPRTSLKAGLRDMWEHLTGDQMNPTTDPLGIDND